MCGVCMCVCMCVFKGKTNLTGDAIILEIQGGFAIC